MMSAPTAFAETPAAAQAVPATNNPGAVTAPGGAASDFQSLLAGAAPAMTPSLIDTLPTLPLAQLLATRNPLPAKPALAATLANSADGSVGNMLRMLIDSAALLSAAPAEGQEAGLGKSELPEELKNVEDGKELDSTLMSDWLDVMLPPMMLAAQNTAGDGATLAGGGGADEGAASLTRAASLAAQLGTPGLQESVDSSGSAPNSTAAAPANVISLARDGVVATQLPAVAAFQAAVAAKSADTGEVDKSLGESFTQALSDLSPKRAAEAPGVAAPRIATPVHDPRWADALAHRLVLMAREGESVASMRLVPQDLGPLDIQITVRDDQASVHFGAAQQETRAALEASLPRLRELLSAQGLQLANASVSQQSSQGTRQERGTQMGGVGAVNNEAEAIATRVISTSLLDIYA